MQAAIPTEIGGSERIPTLLVMIASRSQFFLATVYSAVAFGKIPSLPSLPSTLPSLLTCLNEPSVFSCENTTTIKNTCCSPTPGGLVLQTQFWSTWTGLEKKGQLLPKDSWTIHGLWPDNCDGSVNFLVFDWAVLKLNQGRSINIVIYRDSSIRHRLQQFCLMEPLFHLIKVLELIRLSRALEDRIC